MIPNQMPLTQTIAPADQEEDEDVALSRVIDQHPIVIPDSQPIISENPPPSPLAGNHEVYPRVQFRVGKRDWANLETLAEYLTNLKDQTDLLNEFLKRKKNPETDTRIDLRKLDENVITRKFLALERALWKSNRHGHLFLNKEPPLPTGIRFSGAGNNFRPVIHLRGGNSYLAIMATAVVLYCRPTKCQTLISGRPCNRRHRSVYDFVEYHAGYSVNDIHISHVCQHPLCLNREHLIFEPAGVNLKRNNCRIECGCGARPPCFTSID